MMDYFEGKKSKLIVMNLSYDADLFIVISANFFVAMTTYVYKGFPLKTKLDTFQDLSYP